MPRITKDNPITNYVSRAELNRIRAGIETSARKKTVTVSESTLRELIQWAIGNRGSKHTNPYLVPEVRAMLIEIAEHRGRFSADSWYDALVNWGDHYLLLADYAGYVQAQARVDQAYQNPTDWTVKALRNVAAMGPFSADRTIAEYAEKIWNSPSLEIAG